MGASVIPINNLSVPNLQVAEKNIEVAKLAITVIGLFVAISVTLGDTLKFREKWMHYHNISLFLEKERQLFKNEIGIYSNLHPEEAYKQFVERVENVIAEEKSAILRILAQPNED